MPLTKSIIISAIATFIGVCAYAQTAVQKEIQYLSGTDVTHTKTWDFYCTGGRNSGYWTKIEVPSHWEQQGFGTYNYGRDNVTYGKNFHYADEKGLYKTKFNVPENWRGKDVYIVFEGSMTDTDVKINGQSAGKIHQGSFYRFKYKISDKIIYGKENQLNVTVSKWSSDKSINGAERLADFWIFGGIYRPVYLEILPVENIAWTSINATADGHFAMRVHLNNVKPGREIAAQIFDKKGNLVGTASAKNNDDSIIDLHTKINHPLLWNAEMPNLYTVKIFIKNAGRILYETTDKFGFRTIEVRKQDGIYVNGTKIKVKGVNRHVFWPEYGRATYPEADLLDVQLIKEMNMNAVRCSHYPPDENFLRVCDSLGLYVIDELTGWQKAYSTPVGKPLVKEMVVRDANHPSILFWSNGNEGGHNFDFDNDFGKYDISNRTVIHAHHKPGNAINGIDCNHYEGYYSSQKIMADTNLYMPTEFLHALQDGGGGAGLEDMWELHWRNKKGAGGFIWNFSDEGVVRKDQNNRIDINGTNAPDGIVGPHREKEGSFYAIKEIYSPVHITLKKLPANFDGKIPVENRYHFTNLKECKFQWQLVSFNNKGDDTAGYTIVKTSTFNSPDIAPTDSGFLRLDLPRDWNQYDAVRLTATDPHHIELFTWVWKIKTNSQLIANRIVSDYKNAADVEETDSIVTLKANGVAVSINKKTGLLQRSFNDNGNKFSFNNGPILVSGNAQFQNLKHYKEGNDQVIECNYSGDISALKWRMKSNGLLELSYEYSVQRKVPFAGISFNYPEGLVMGAKWLGNGPYRVWENRLKGVMPGEYESWYNNTQTGNAPWLYPEFKGYFSDIVWMEFNTMEGKFTVASPDENLFVRMFDFYGINGNKPHPLLPVGDISFLDAIPPVGSKMGISNEEVRQLGPMSDLNILEKPLKRTLYFYFKSIAN